MGARGSGAMRCTVQFIDNLQAGGRERTCVEVAKMLSARGDWQTYVVTMSEELFFTELETLPRVQIVRLLRRSRRDPSVLWRFADLCRQWQPDIINAWQHMTMLYAIPAAKWLRIPLVTAQVQDAPARLNWKLRWRSALAFAAADAVICNSKAGMAVYGAPAHKTHLIHSPYDLQRASPGAASARWAQELKGDGRLVVGMVATFSRFKDQPTLIEAARRILARRDDVRFVFVGGGPTLAACQALLADGEQDRIRILGRVPDAVEDIARHFDIGVLATFTEGISNSIIEYMVLGKPVVATAGGGTPELVEDGRTGFLVGERDPDALAAQIERLLDDPALRERLGQAGRAKVHAEFVLERTVQKYADLYDTMLR
jgi:glycosyltransferase involved in cell wall biosynthesis